MDHRSDPAIRYRRAAGIEWPTVGLAIVIYGGWLLATLFWSRIPLWLLFPLGGWLVSWHGSLQHEVMHGHPTRNRRLNDIVGYPPLALWLPYSVYKLSHLSHHRDERLTDPLDDPESFYVTGANWLRFPRVLRALLIFNQTLLGRVLIGPLFMSGFFLLDEFRRLRAGQPGRRRIWLQHAVSLAILVTWITVACGMPLWLYLLTFVYVGGALTRIRSFAEHRFADRHEERTAIVEHGGLFGLLYLNNNLHVLHHLRPAIPWYDLPALYRAHREELVARNGGLVYRSYGDVFGQFFLTPHDKLLHPHHLEDTVP